MQSSTIQGRQRERSMRIFRIVIAFLIVCAPMWRPRALGATFNFSYSGRLTELNGKPVAGPVALSMAFYQTSTGGSPVLTVTDGLGSVQLQEGLFQVSLMLSGSDFHAAFPSVTDSVYIEITDLTHRPNSPYDRQLVAMVPYAAKVPVDGVTLEFNSQGELTLKNTPASGAAAISTINAATAGTIAVERLPALGGDLSGTLGAASVVKIQGRPVAATAPNNNEVLKWNGSAWTPAAMEGGSPITPSTNLALGSVSSSVQAGLVAAPFGATAGQTGELRFKELTAGGDNFVGFKAPDAIAGSAGAGIIWTLPGSDGGSGQVLSTNGSGVLAWASAGVDTNAKTLCADNQYLRGDDTTTCRTAAQIVSDGGGLSSGAIVNADINASAAIVDTKLATIATAGKVADTALSANVSLLGSSIDLTSEISGILPVANGGTGVASALTGVAIGNGASAMTSVAGTASQYLRRNAGNTAYEFATLGALASLAEVGGGSGGTITDDSITNDDIKSNAGIVDTKLATIATAGKVADTALSANVSLLGSSISLTTEVAGTLPLSNGGTGGTTQAEAANAVLPTQTSNSGKYLTTNGTNVSWATVSTTVSSLAASDGTPAQALAVDADGNVGIGTTAPSAKLQVVGFDTGGNLRYGAMTGTQTVSRYDDNSLADALVLANLHGSSGAGYGIAQIFNLSRTGDQTARLAGRVSVATEQEWTSTVSTNDSYLALSTTADGSTGERMRIASNGNVGIGTTSPGQLLSVAGTIESTSGGIKFPDASVQTTAASSNPVGVVSLFANTSMPSGYLACNGAAVSRTTYSALFAAIGTAFGAGDGSTTFNLPDANSPLAAGAGAFRYYRLYITNISSGQYAGVGEVQFYWSGAWQTNAMTGNSSGTIGGLSATSSASTAYAGTAAWNIFDNDTAVAWSSTADYTGGTGNDWLQVDFGVSNAPTITQFRMWGRGSPNEIQAPTGFYLRGSNDGSTWTTVGKVQTGQVTSGSWNTYMISGGVGYGIKY